MSKLFDQHIEVSADSQGRPLRFKWRGRRLRVKAVIDDWEERGRWWLREPSRRVYRVQALSGGIYELHHFPDLCSWTLARVFD